MSRHSHTESIGSPSALTPSQVERVRTALRSVAAEELELGAEELEDRIMPGLSATN